MSTIVICCADCGTAVPAGKKHCPQCGKRVGVGPSEDAAAISGNGGGIPSAYETALKRAQSYADMMHMSKKGIYDQLVSEYGENVPADAAQYAVDNLAADHQASALAKARSYRDTMHMARGAIYDQLVSEYGEQFTPEEAQYAMDHLD